MRTSTWPAPDDGLVPERAAAAGRADPPRAHGPRRRARRRLPEPSVARRSWTTTASPRLQGAAVAAPMPPAAPVTSSHPLAFRAHGLSDGEPGSHSGPGRVGPGGRDAVARGGDDDRGCRRTRLGAPRGSWAFAGVLLCPLSFSVPLTEGGGRRVQPVPHRDGPGVIAEPWPRAARGPARPRPPRAPAAPLLDTMLGAVFGWPILLALHSAHDIRARGGDRRLHAADDRARRRPRPTSASPGSSGGGRHGHRGAGRLRALARRGQRRRSRRRRARRRRGASRRRGATSRGHPSRARCPAGRSSRGWWCLPCP